MARLYDNRYALDRAQAISAVGLRAVEAVEALNCEPTNRVLPAPHKDELVEWAATIRLIESPVFRHLNAYYYTPKADWEAEEQAAFDWVVDHYTLD